MKAMLANTVGFTEAVRIEDSSAMLDPANLGRLIRACGSSVVLGATVLSTRKLSRARISRSASKMLRSALKKDSTFLLTARMPVT
jgi:hypothetical protein